MFVYVCIYLTRACTVLAQSVGDGPITTIGWGKTETVYNTHLHIYIHNKHMHLIGDDSVQHTHIHTHTCNTCNTHTHTHNTHTHTHTSLVMTSSQIISKLLRTGCSALYTAAQHYVNSTHYERTVHTMNIHTYTQHSVHYVWYGSLV